MRKNIVKKKQGRPLKEIDKTQFEKLCHIQCTLEEVASYFDCDMDTVESWCKRTYNKVFSEVFRLKRGRGRVSLRRRQFEAALAGDKTLLVWLGKQYLGQKDRIDMHDSLGGDNEKVNKLKLAYNVEEKDSK